MLGINKFAVLRLQAVHAKDTQGPDSLLGPAALCRLKVVAADRMMSASYLEKGFSADRERWREVFTLSMGCDAAPLQHTAGVSGARMLPPN